MKLHSLIAAALLAAATSAGAVPLQQYASTLKGFSSEYVPSAASWNAIQVLDAPNTLQYGDHVTAWAPATENSGFEWISVGFDTAVYASGATIRETYNNGFVYQVDAIDTLGNLHTVWNGVDTSAANVPFNFTVAWSTTSYLVNGLKVYVDTRHSNSWEEIDAIRLLGDTVAPPVVQVPEPASLGLLGAGFALIGWTRRRQARRAA
ncbi:PEP-CTERM sorting domain-containing protein [Massilia sp. 9I]|uniref:PEP-CTERM sorting domain-containing protein n=1 Tax=Massilia sp. 9I TaxID=2653152 RepID=UPI0012EFBD28|nr:PEP-CTERM sorting domain-containing protein [Massilia sp. 9I]VXC13312.1 PEP-CTERM protein sorting domain protein [Massilia sp. 9I]